MADNTKSEPFIQGDSEIANTIEDILTVVEKVARHTENLAMYGPEYQTLMISKATKEWFEGSEMAKSLKLDMGSEFAGPWGAVQYWEEIQRAINEGNLALGIGGQIAKNMREDLIKSRSSLLGLNLDIENFTASYSTFVEEYGRPFAPSNMDIENMATINKGFKGQFDGLIPIAKLYGRSIQDTRDFINDAMVKSDKYGISVNKVLSEIQKNIQMVDRYTFKGGLEGLKKMSIEAQRLNLSMSSVVQFSEKFYNPEDAIEMAASLQMMGGEFAQFGDVFQLMYDANNDVGSLITKVSELTKGMGMLNKETGEIEFTSLERRQLKYFESVSGISVEEMMKTRRVQKQEEMVRRVISPEFKAGSMEDLEKNVNKIAMLATFKGGVPKITIDNKEKLVSEVSVKDLERLSAIGQDPLKDPIENLISVNVTANEHLQKIYGQIVILANDFETLNATELAVKSQQALAKSMLEPGSVTRFAQEQEKGIKKRVMRWNETVAEVGTSFNIGKWFDNMINQNSFSNIIGVGDNNLSKKTGLSSIPQRNDLNISSFSEIKSNQTDVQRLVEQYRQKEMQAVRTTDEAQRKMFFEGKDGVIKLELNGKTFKSIDLAQDKDFQEAYRKQFNEAILSTKDNGGKNTSPNPRY